MSRPVGTTKRFCHAGHDTEVTGRYANRSCKECNRQQQPYKRARSLRDAGQGVLAAPIRALTSRHELVLAWACYRGVTDRTAERNVAWLYSVRVISIDDADEWCCALDTHLALVYPELYREVVSA